MVTTNHQCTHDPISRHGHAEQTCPTCREVSRATFWFIVDEAEHPELFSNFAFGVPEQWSCERCATYLARVESTVLLRQRNGTLLLVAGNTKTEDELFGTGAYYLDLLREAGGTKSDLSVEVIPYDLVQTRLSKAAEYSAARDAYFSDLLNRADRSADIDEKVELLERLLAQSGTRQHEGRAFLQRRVAELLLSRGLPDDIERAVAQLHKVLIFYDRERSTAEWARTITLLAAALMRRRMGHDECDSAAATQLLDEASSVLSPATDLDLWLSVNIPRISARLNHPAGDAVENRREAIRLAREVIARAHGSAKANAERQLAHALVRMTRETTTGDFDEAIALARQQLDAGVDTFEAQQVLVEAYVWYPGGGYDDDAVTVLTQALSDATDPDAVATLAQELADVEFRRKQWSSSFAAYQQARRALEELLATAASHDTSVSILRRGDEFYTTNRAAYALAKQGESLAAAAWIDEGRARHLRHATMEPAVLDAARDVMPKTVFAYERSRHDLAELEASLARYERTHGVRPDDASQATQLRQGARDHQRFMRAAMTQIHAAVETPDSKEVILDVARAIPIAYIGYTDAGGFIILVTSTGASTIWLPITTEDIREWCYDEDHGLLTTYAQLRDEQSSTARAKWARAVDWVTSALRVIMQPLVATLASEGHNRCALVPNAFLAFLPLHAARIDDSRYAMDHTVFTYVPSAWALREQPPERRGTVLAISDPDDTLTFTRVEVRAACMHLAGGLLEGANATRAAIMAALPRYDVIHFGCHGRAFPQEPFRSGLTVADARLTVRDIAIAQGPQTAILSACEASMPGAIAPDEGVGLPNAFLAVGYRRVIAPMWVVDDYVTMVLMMRFYEGWCRRQLSASAALRDAQQWLRSSDPAEKMAYVTTAIATLRQQGRISAEAANDVLSNGYALGLPQTAAAWAAFAVYGAP